MNGINNAKRQAEYEAKVLENRIILLERSE